MKKKKKKITFLILASIKILSTPFLVSVRYHAIYDNNNMNFKNTYNKGKKTEKKKSINKVELIR